MAIPITARVKVDFRPRSKPDIVIWINVPTPYERDAFAALLVRGGVVQYTQQQIRDLMLAGVSAIYPDQYDDYRVGLEEVWADGDEQRRVNLARATLEVELRQKYEEKHRDRTPTDKQRVAMEKDISDQLADIQPQVVVDDQKRVAIAVLQQEMMSRFGPLHKALGDLAEQKVRRDWLTVETYVSTWENLHDTPDGNGKGGITRAEAEYLRTKLGSDAFEELGDFIFALHSLDEDEEKNLASLLESMSAPTGSTPSDLKASSEAGNSTGAPSGGIPETE